jgi:two-component system OmpR family sensor kinase
VRYEGSHEFAGDQEIVELVPAGRPAHRDPDAPPRRLVARWRTWRPPGWPADRLAGAAGRLTGRISPRARVVVALLAIAATGFIAFGMTAVSVLDHYLTDRADTQLKAASSQLETGSNWIGASPDYTQTSDPVRRRLFRQGYIYGNYRPLPEGVVAQLSFTGSDRTREYGPTSWSGPSGPVLPDRAAERAGRPFTVPARDGSGHWRVLVTTPSDSLTQAVATDLGPVDQATGKLKEITLITGGLALAAMGFVGFRIARAGESSLTEIEQTVEAAVAGDLSRRVPEPDTEPGQVARAVNTLIEQIDDARQAEERTRRSIGEAGRAVRLPLNVIQGFAEFYRDRPSHDPARMARLVDRVGDEAARIEIVIDDLLSDLVKSTNGHANGDRGHGPA